MKSVLAATQSYGNIHKRRWSFFLFFATSSPMSAFFLLHLWEKFKEFGPLPPQNCRRLLLTAPMCSVSVSVSNHILHTVGRVSIDLHMLTTWICPEGQHHGWQHFLGMMSALKFLPRKPGLPEIFSQLKKIQIMFFAVSVKANIMVGNIKYHY